MACGKIEMEQNRTYPMLSQVNNEQWMMISDGIYNVMQWVNELSGYGRWSDELNKLIDWLVVINIAGVL